MRDLERDVLMNRNVTLGEDSPLTRAPQHSHGASESMQASACTVKLVVMLKHSSSAVEFKEISIMSRVLLQSVPIVALQLSIEVFKLPRSSALELVLLPEQVRFDASPPPTKVMLSLMLLKSSLLANLPSIILSCFSILFFLLRKLPT